MKLGDHYLALLFLKVKKKKKESEKKSSSRVRDRIRIINYDAKSKSPWETFSSQSIGTCARFQFWRNFALGLELQVERVIVLSFRGFMILDPTERQNPWWSKICFPWVKALFSILKEKWENEKKGRFEKLIIRINHLWVGSSTSQGQRAGFYQCFLKKN